MKIDRCRGTRWRCRLASLCQSRSPQSFIPPHISLERFYEPWHDIPKLLNADAGLPAGPVRSGLGQRMLPPRHRHAQRRHGTPLQRWGAVRLCGGRRGAARRVVAAAGGRCIRAQKPSPSAGPTPSGMRRRSSVRGRCRGAPGGAGQGSGVAAAATLARVLHPGAAARPVGRPAAGRHAAPLQRLGAVPRCAGRRGGTGRRRR